MTDEALVLDPITMPDQSSFQAALIRLPGLPLAVHRRAKLREAIGTMESHAVQNQNQTLLHDVYVQMAQIERPGGPLLLSKNGPRWMPSPGVGVWPDKEPPRSMSVRDFELLKPGEKMGSVSYQVLRLNVRDEAMRVEALDVMGGTGAMMWMLVSEEDDEARDRRSVWLEERMTEESFRGHPFYAPLLDTVSLSRMSPQDLDACLSGVALYFREDVTEHGVLVISSTPFEQLLSKRVEISQR